MAKRILKRGFTLVELMIVVAIIGVLAALAIYGVRKYLNNAKTAEARDGLGRMSKDASAAFDRENMAGAALNPGASAGVSNRLCASAAANVPTSMAGVTGQKYQSAPSEWNAGDKVTGWACLKFSMQDPQYYMYSYVATDPTSTDASSFVSMANGDLNGDGVTSKFTLKGGLVKDSAGSIVMRVAPTFDEDKAEE